MGFIQHYLEDNNNTLKVGNVTTQVLDVNATIADKEGKITSYIVLGIDKNNQGKDYV